MTLNSVLKFLAEQDESTAASGQPPLIISCHSPNDSSTVNTIIQGNSKCVDVCESNSSSRYILIVFAMPKDQLWKR